MTGGIRQLIYTSDYCDVCNAICLETRKSVVIKVLHGQQGIIDGTHESRMLRLLGDDQKQISKHYVIPLLDFFLSSNSVHLVFPRLEPLPPQLFSGNRSLHTVVDFAAQLLAALAFVHRKGLAHLDVKPDNILYDKVSNSLRVIDFGLALRADGSDIIPIGRGSRGFRSPELDVDCDDYDGDPCKCDVWSAGIVIEKWIANLNVSTLNHSHSKLLRQIRSLLKDMNTENPVNRISSSDALGRLHQLQRHRDRAPLASLSLNQRVTHFACPGAKKGVKTTSQISTTSPIPA